MLARHIAVVVFIAIGSMLSLVHIAAAQQSDDTVFFPNDTSINYLVNAFVIVGEDNYADYGPRINPTSPTVHLETGAGTTGFFQFVNGSTADIDGVISGDISLTDQSTAHFNGGTVSDLLDFSSTPLNITSGNISSFEAGEQSGPVTISGGTFGPYFGLPAISDENQQFTFDGIDLTATDVGPLPGGSGVEDYELNGHLADESNATGVVVAVSTSVPRFEIVNTPEPASTTFFAIAAASLLRRGRAHCPSPGAT